MSAFSVRPATSADRDAVAQLGREVAALPLLVRYGLTPAGLAADLVALLPPAGSELPPPTQAQLLLAEAQEDPALARARASETAAAVLLGFARFQLRGTLGAGGYLQLIALRPGQAGRGVGVALLRAVEAAVAQASPHLFLLTSDFNHGAQRFYEREGYTRCGQLPGFARPDITELLYWKRLPRPAR